jgi:hypothetical protein
MFTKMTVDISGSKLPIMTNGVPVWAVVELGKTVKLTRPFAEYEDVVHKVGKVGVLDAIQAEAPASSVALVEFEDGALVAIPFDYLVPVKGA